MRYSIYFPGIIYFCISGCASGPTTYEEIDQAAFDAREEFATHAFEGEDHTLLECAKNLNRAEKRLSNFEANVKKAEVYYANKAACQAAVSEYMWYCEGYQQRRPRKNEQLHEYVRRFLDERTDCGCAKRGDVIW